MKASVKEKSYDGVSIVSTTSLRAAEPRQRLSAPVSFGGAGPSIFGSPSLARQSLTSKCLSDLIRCRLRVVPEQRVDGHHHARAAESTLRAMTLGKPFLRDKGTPPVR